MSVAADAQRRRGVAAVPPVAPVSKPVDVGTATPAVPALLPDRAPFELHGHRKKVFQVQFSATGDRIASASADNTSFVWTVDERRGPSSTPDLELKGHTDDVMALRWDPTNPNVLLTVGGDKTARFWDVRIGGGRTPNVATVALGGGDNINAAWHPKGGDVAVGNNRDLLSFIDVRTHKVARSQQFPYELNEVLWNASGTAFMASTLSGVEVFGKWPSMERTYTVPTGFAYSLALSYDGSTLAVGGYDANAMLIDVSELACRLVVPRSENKVQALAFSHDSAFLAMVPENESFIDIADSSDGSCVCTVPTRLITLGVAWSPRAYLLAYAGHSQDGMGCVRVWSATAPKPAPRG